MEGVEEAAMAAAAPGALIDSKDLQQQSKAFDKLTDRVEDRQLDSSRVQSAMAALATAEATDLDALKQRDKELASVKIDPAELDLMVHELELDKKVAEKSLREHKGNLVAAVLSHLR